MTFPTGWTKRSAITVPAAQVGSGGVTSFTVLLTEASINANSQTDLFANAKSDGSDLRVSTDSAGTNLLTVDVIEYDAVGATFVIRVGTLTLSAVSANTLYLWWGNSAATAQTGGGAYDSDWIHYFPDGSATGNRIDGTSPGVATGSLTPGDRTGLLMDGTDYNGSSYYEIAGTQDEEFTFLAWGNSDVLAFEGLAGNFDVSVDSGWTIKTRNNGDVWFRFGNLAASPAFLTAKVAGLYSVGNWVQLGLTVSVSADLRSGIHNGATTGFDTRTDHDASGSGYAIGRSPDAGGEIWNGVLSEAQYHGVQRGAAWLETEYNQTNTPASFASSGDPVAVGGAPGVRRRSRWL